VRIAALVFSVVFLLGVTACGGGKEGGPSYNKVVAERCLQDRGMSTKKDGGLFFEGTIAGSFAVEFSDKAAYLVFGATESQANDLANQARESLKMLGDFDAANSVTQEGNVVFYVTSGSLPKSAATTIEHCLLGE